MLSIRICTYWMKISVSALFKRMIGMAEAGLDAGKSNVIIHKETEFYSTDYNPSALLGSYDTLTRCTRHTHTIR